MKHKGFHYIGMLQLCIEELATTISMPRLHPMVKVFDDAESQFMKCAESSYPLSLELPCVCSQWGRLNSLLELVRSQNLELLLTYRRAPVNDTFCWYLFVCIPLGKTCVSIYKIYLASPRHVLFSNNILLRIYTYAYVCM